MICVIGNATEWCIESWEKEIHANTNLCFCNDMIPFSGNKILRRLCEIHFSQKLNKKINFPFKRIWYKQICNAMNLSQNSENLVIIYDWSRLSVDIKFVKYLRDTYKNIKIVYMFTNVVRQSGAVMYGILEKLRDVYDKVFAFDKMDAKKYNFEYSPLIYTRSDTSSRQQIDSDLFYIGQAKDRLDDLITIYEKATCEGFKCDFYIVGVEPDKQKYPDQIKYNQRLTYKEVLDRIKKTRCIVDATQHNSSGLTIKVCEAVIFNKKLISTNKFISEQSFFVVNRIYDANDQLSKFSDFMKAEMVPYTDIEKSVFSPETLYKCIFE